jgi:hypothetical protein
MLMAVLETYVAERNKATQTDTAEASDGGATEGATQTAPTRPESRVDSPTAEQAVESRS